jgi:activator of HSP90 ATPase
MSASESQPAAVSLQQRLREVRRSRDFTVPMKSITNRVSLAAPPAKVYATLLDAAKLTEITGAPVRLDPQPGGEFSARDGAINGLVAELLENRHIAIACRLDDERWPKQHYSTATFMLKPEGTGTLLTFYQQDVPEALRDPMAEAWEESYWTRLPGALG